MKYEIIYLEEQKYMGIKTKIEFKDHDDIDFGQLHRDVVNAGIPNLDKSQRFLAMDSDFTETSFCYTPLMPVHNFEGDYFYRFIRAAGEYYCFDVAVKDLGPSWFDQCISFLKQINANIDRAFDLEYYREDYLSDINKDSFNYRDETIQIIFRKTD